MSYKLTKLPTSPISQTKVEIKTIQSSDAAKWDEYVYSNPKATLYHLYGWQNVINKTYGHKTYYLMAIQDNPTNSTNPMNSTNPTNPSNPMNSSNPTNPIVGILPLVHLKHFLFGNSLISIPFFDLGGVLANDEETEKTLLSKTIELAQKLKVNTIELRHTEPLSCLNPSNPTNSTNSMNPTNPINPITYKTRSHKLRMLLNLPDSSETLMQSFKSKLRSQIKKPVKEGLYPKIGGLELLEDFYRVFLINMKDLGSPVHSRSLIQNVLEEFPDKAKIVVVYKDHIPIASSLIAGFNNTLENPWASALRKYSNLSPNMLLYWTMLKYACDNGFAFFDFGRSSEDEGTYKFKEQWGAKPSQLYWHYLFLNGQKINQETPEKPKFEKAIQYWQRFPLPVTRILGPMIRKHIGL